MQFKFDARLEAFREEVRAYLRENLPKDIAMRTRQACFGPLEADSVRWTRILYEKGWSAPPHWPVEWGGTGWTPLQHHIFQLECHMADAPMLPFQGLTLVGPVVYSFGSEAQKKRFLQPILAGTEFWCQGFSEPNAGSDLASLRTKAVRDGDHYVVNGQKIWTSQAHHADWGFFLVKTNLEGKPQRGISFLLIDMKTPGLTVRPMLSIDGKEHLTEVFLDNVRVPAENLVGEENKGWDYAKFLLANERTASAFIYYTKRQVAYAKEMARQEMRHGRPLLETPEFRHKLARVDADATALEMSVLRVLADEDNPENPTAVASALKVRGSELQQRVMELQMDVLGWRSARYFPAYGTYDLAPGWPDYAPARTGEYLLSHASTIYGGARDVQKNIIAKLAFGL